MLCVVVSIIVWYGNALSFLFFFQAEDGIRDLVRSRGLGDVYKRQGQRAGLCPRERHRAGAGTRAHRPRSAGLPAGARAVSYTHLTLPTSDLV